MTILSRVVMEPRGERQLCGEASCTNPNTNASFLLGEDCTVRTASVHKSSQNTKQTLPLQQCLVNVPLMAPEQYWHQQTLGLSWKFYWCGVVFSAIDKKKIFSWNILAAMGGKLHRRLWLSFRGWLSFLQVPRLCVSFVCCRHFFVMFKIKSWSKPGMAQQRWPLPSSCWTSLEYFGGSSLLKLLGRWSMLF